MRPVCCALLIVCLAPWTAVAATVTSAPVRIESSAAPAGRLDVSLAKEVDAAIDRALAWLAARQKDDGSWSNAHFPALTALALQPFLRSEYPGRAAVTDKAVRFLKTCVRDDGGIYADIPGRKGGGLSNYNTAICMVALHETGRAELVPVVQKARTFLKGAQHFGDDVYRGGFGYDRSTGRAYTDLMNTFYSVEAMRLTQSVEDLRPAGESRADIDWKEAARYIERMQNKPAAGTNEAGGFFYKPGESKAGSTTNAAGVVVLRSYGSITYAGLLALIYADVSRDDPRVRSAFDWAANHWTLEENPGMGQQGLFFFYNVITRSLAAYGQDLVPRPNDQFVDWRRALAIRLVQVQRIDADQGHGYWQNLNGRFWENDPLLSTAYCLAALQMLQ